VEPWLFANRLDRAWLSAGGLFHQPSRLGVSGSADGVEPAGLRNGGNQMYRRTVNSVEVLARYDGGAGRHALYVVGSAQKVRKFADLLDTDASLV
jgi:hypothetical protein